MYAIRSYYEQAIRRMRVALSEMSIQGIKTNIALHQELMYDAHFIEGGASIHSYNFV